MLCPVDGSLLDTGLGVFLCKYYICEDVIYSTVTHAQEKLEILRHKNTYQSLSSTRQHDTGQWDADRKFVGVHSAERNADWETSNIVTWTCGALLLTCLRENKGEIQIYYINYLYVQQLHNLYSQ